MSIFTDPIFYYVDGVTSNNFILNFNEGSGELAGEMAAGGNSMQELVNKAAIALNDSGTQEYTVSLDRDTRFVTISAASAFDLLPVTGVNAGLTGFGLLGFTTDRTGLTSYVGDIAIGTEFEPQFALQKFKSFDDNLRGIRSSVNESANGDVEIVTFGNSRLMSFNIKYITDKIQGKGSPIRYNPTGKQEANSFMVFCISKENLEFMPDKTDRATFDTILLDKTNVSKDGTSYELFELFSRKLIGYFETKTITFRKV